MRISPRIKRYLPALGVALALAVIFGYFLIPSPQFEPTELKQLTVVDDVDGDLIFTKSEPLTILDGLCNKTDTDRRVVITLSAQENTTAFGARVLYFSFDGVTPPQKEETSYTLTLTPGCYKGTERLVTRIPQSLPAGEWKLAAHIETMGQQAGRIQRIDKLSNVFKVLD